MADPAQEADDDGDVAAIDGGSEPESPTGDAPDDSDDGEDAFDAQSTLAARIVKASSATRPISKRTRELFAAASQKIKASKGDDDEDVAFGLDEAEAAPAGAQGQAGAAAPAAGQAAAKTGAAAAVVPPAPSLDPQVAELRQQWTAKIADLDKREQQIVERERTGDVGKLRDKYFERGADALVDVIKQWSIAETDDDLKDEIASVVAELSSKVLGVEVPREALERASTRRTAKSIKIMKADMVRDAEAREAQIKAREDEANRTRVKAILGQELAKKEHAEAFPWLASEDAPGDIVFDVVEAALKRDGTQLTWQEAAKRANDFLKNQASAYYDKRKHLLAGPAQAGAGAPQQQRTGRPSGPQVTRPPQTAQPPPAPQQPPAIPPVNGKWNDEAHRRATKQRFRAAFQPRPEDAD